MKLILLKTNSGQEIAINPEQISSVKELTNKQTAVRIMMANTEEFFSTESMEEFLERLAPPHVPSFGSRHGE